MSDLIPWRKREVDSAPGRSSEDPWMEMDSLFEHFFGRAPAAARFGSGKFAPAIDIRENDREFVVKADLPGIDPSEVDISLAGDLLTIKGEKKEEKEEKDDNYHRVERRYGSFSRSFHLPCEVNEEKISAKYKNGVLDLTIPKAESAKKKSVKIEVEKG